MSRPGRRSATSSSLWCRRTSTGPPPDWRRSPKSDRRPRAHEGLRPIPGSEAALLPAAGMSEPAATATLRFLLQACASAQTRGLSWSAQTTARPNGAGSRPGPHSPSGSTVLLGAQDGTAGSGLIDCGGGCCELVVLTRRLTRAGGARRNPLCGHQIGSLGRSLVEIRRKRRWAAWTQASDLGKRGAGGT